MASEKQILRDKINGIVDSLLPENRDYFEDIREYMLFKSFLKDEKAILEQIYSLASDLKMAEADGLTAVDFFGTDAKGMADQLLEHAPRISFKELASTYLSAVLALFGIELLLLFLDTGHFQLELYLFIAACLGALLLCWAVFFLLPKVLFKDNPSKLLIGLILIIGMMLFNVIAHLPAKVADNGIYLRFPEIFDWVFVVGVGLATLLLAITKKTFRAFAFPIFAFLVNGILKKLMTMGLISGQLWSVWLPILLTLTAVLLFYRMNRNLLKDQSD